MVQLNLKIGAMIWLLGMALMFPYISKASEIKNNHFLVISDIHLNIKSRKKMTFTPNYTTKDNDLDYKSFIEILKIINKKIEKGSIPRPQFILILGDIKSHGHSSLKNAKDSERMVFSVFKKMFADIPIFYVFGNNDSLGKNYGPFSSRRSKLSSPYEIAIQQGGWKDGFLSTGTLCSHQGLYPCIDNKNLKYGYYSALITTKFRLIALNSVLFSGRHANKDFEKIDRQLLWLESQLNTAKLNHESVLIAMHIPPGFNIYDHSEFWKPQYVARFLNIIGHYHQNIMGILSAHTHQDEIKIIKNSTKQNKVGIFFTPALSTAYGNSPAFKSFDFIKQKNGQWVLSNYETFQLVRHAAKVEINPLYNYRSYYCPHSETNLFQCLDYVTPKKMKKMITAGNPNYRGDIKWPQDMNLVIAESK